MRAREHICKISQNDTLQSEILRILPGFSQFL